MGQQDSAALQLSPEQRDRGLTDAARFAGRQLFLLACAALGIAELLFLRPLPQLHLLDQVQQPLLAPAMGASLAGLALLCLFRTTDVSPAVGLAGTWLVALLFALAAALSHPSDLLGWVPASKAALFALAAVAIAPWPNVARAAVLRAVMRLTFGFAMLFYACVHLLHRALIAELIPAWVPGRDSWPWLTATVFGTCGVALLNGKLARPAAFIIASMVGSWILFLHIERVAADPLDIFEWAFALSALALFALALIVAA